MTRVVFASCIYSADVAIQRQAVHADVPSHPGSASATLPAYGASRATTPHAPRDIRRRPCCAGGAWCVRVCVPAVLPWTGVFISTALMVVLLELTALGSRWCSR